jgi:hypothetical protein
MDELDGENQMNMDELAVGEEESPMKKKIWKQE